MSELFQHRARKRFGQNFLHDAGVIHRILRAIAPKEGQHLLEIGPGQGALTEGLVDSGAQLDVIELDLDLIPQLKWRFGLKPNFRLHQGDALKFDFATLPQAGEKLRVVGNLPYNISSPILFHCIDAIDAIADMHFMLQKEVVDRMAAAPGSKVYGRLSVMLQLACRVEPLLEVPPSAFIPPPKVDSAVVRLVPRPAPERPDAAAAAIARVVKAAFGQRRKTLSNALHGVLDAGQIVAAGIDPKTRAEQLPPQAFVALARALPPAA